VSGPRRRRERRSATDFILLDRSRCEACWECIEACPQSVLGKVDFLGHRHAKIRAADECIGCGRCVKVCEQGALTRRSQARSSQAGPPDLPSATDVATLPQAKQPVLP
jgi:NAD-dependent dihydropyrimidine dehydrogenase PreA subunit